MAPGSAAYERFTATQILKKKQQQPDVYSNTAHISLISSAMCVGMQRRLGRQLMLSTGVLSSWAALRPLTPATVLA